MITIHLGSRKNYKQALLWQYEEEKTKKNILQGNYKIW